MSAPMSPCQFCPDRYVGCKSSCDRWGRYSSEFTEYKAVVNAAKKRYFDLTYHAIESNTKGKKLRGGYRK